MDNPHTSTLLKAISQAMEEMDARRPKIGSVAQACAAILFEMDQLWIDAMYAVQGSSGSKVFQTTLIRMAAIACRAARDLNRQDAV